MPVYRSPSCLKLAVVAGEDEMVDERASDRFGAAGESPGGAEVASARRRIAARVIMRQDQPGASAKRRIRDDRTQWEVRPVFVARMAGQVNAIGLIVEVGDPEVFARGIRIVDAAGEEGASRGEASSFSGSSAR